MLTTEKLQQFFAGAVIRPAVNAQNPEPGDLVRNSVRETGTRLRTGHRDIYIESSGTDDLGRACLRTVCISDFGLIRSTTYADKNGCYTFYLAAAPSGPYTDARQQDHWRTGYSDALEFVESNERFIVPSEEYRAGRAAGRQVRGDTPPRYAMLTWYAPDYEPQNERRPETFAFVAYGRNNSKDLRTNRDRMRVARRKSRIITRAAAA